MIGCSTQVYPNISAERNVGFVVKRAILVVAAANHTMRGGTRSLTDLRSARRVIAGGQADRFRSDSTELASRVHKSKGRQHSFHSFAKL
jgi:hypothetical protein